MKENLNTIVADFMKANVVKSWTWARMDAEQRAGWNKIAETVYAQTTKCDRGDRGDKGEHLWALRGNFNQRWRTLMCYYSIFCDGCGIKYQ